MPIWVFSGFRQLVHAQDPHKEVNVLPTPVLLNAEPDSILREADLHAQEDEGFIVFHLLLQMHLQGTHDEISHIPHHGLILRVVFGDEAVNVVICGNINTLAARQGNNSSSHEVGFGFCKLGQRVTVHVAEHLQQCTEPTGKAIIARAWLVLP